MLRDQGGSPHLFEKIRQKVSLNELFSSKTNMAMDNHHFQIGAGDTSSNVCFSIVVSVFVGVTSKCVPFLLAKAFESHQLKMRRNKSYAKIGLVWSRRCSIEKS